MRLNGWQRIGVVASVLWAVGAFVAVMQSKDWATEQFEICLNVAVRTDQRDMERCPTDMEKNGPVALGHKQIAAIGAALAPIPIGWFLVYLGVWVGRWVRRGFTPAPSS